MATSLAGARAIEGAVGEAGYRTGGWGRTLWCVNSCTAYLTCTTAVTDAPSMTKVLYDAFTPYFTGEVALPAKLKIHVAGCPSSCGSLVADVVVSGHYGDAPTCDPVRIRACLPARAETLDTATPELVMVCPTGAIKAVRKPDTSVGIEIVREKCIGCGRCRDVCDFITWDKEKIGVCVMVGGRSSNTGLGPTLARMLVPWIPVRPPGYGEVVAVVAKVIDTWRAGARPGERMADYVERVGMEALLAALAVPLTRHNRPSRIGPGFGLRQLVGGDGGGPPAAAGETRGHG
jgi:sulfite reductase beta subunit